MWNDKTKLLAHTAAKALLGFLLMGLLLFGCAGSLHYSNAWLMMALLAAMMLALGIYLLAKAPEVLRRRARAKEPQKAQKWAVGLIGVAIIASLALAGLDYRFGWSSVPFAVPIITAGVMVLGYGLYAAGILQNAYAARVVQAEQTVIDTGLYAVVRHPMYLAFLILFLAVPFVLGSYLALAPVPLLVVGLVLRIKNEEAVLARELTSYTAYMQKAKYRLIPFVW